MVGLIILAMIQKPEWCVRKGAEMMPDCSSDVNKEVFYHQINTISLKPRVSFILSFGLMYTLLLFQILKVQFLSEVYFKEALKMYLQIIVFSLSLLLTFLETIDAMEKSDFNNILKLVFAVCCSTELMNIFFRLFRMLIDTKDLIFLLFFILIVVGTFFRVIFHGVEFEEDENFLFSYSFTTFWRSFESTLLTMIGDNFPDFVLSANKVSFIYGSFIFAFYFFSF